MRREAIPATLVAAPLLPFKVIDELMMELILMTTLFQKF